MNKSVMIRARVEPDLKEEELNEYDNLRYTIDLIYAKCYNAM